MTHTLFSTRHGSHLYGTHTANSDMDEVHVLLPTGRELLLGRVPGYGRTGLGASDGSRPAMRKGAEDFMFAPLHRVVEKILEAEPNSVELLFSPKESWLDEPDPLWLKLVANRERLLCANFSRYASFAYDQAKLYGVSPRNREAAVQASIFFDNLEHRYNPKARLLEGLPEIEAFFAGYDHLGALSFEDVPNHAQRTTVRYVNVCGKRYELTAHMGYVAELVKRTAKKLTAEATDAAAKLNWKAIATAFRISEQALELMETGQLTFPRPNAAYIRAVKAGDITDLPSVIAKIEQNLARAEEAARTTSLPAEPDRAFADEFLLEAHLEAVRRDPTLRNLTIQQAAA